MRYGNLVQTIRRQTRDSVAEAIISSRPETRGKKAVDVRKATLDGLVDALADEIMLASKPGYEFSTADMVALKVISEVARRTTVGSA